MNLGRWMLALIGALAVSVLSTAPAAAIGGPDGPPPIGDAAPPCLCAGSEDAQEEEPGDDGAAREAVRGRIPARIGQRLLTARRALRDAERTADAGSDRRAAAYLKRVVENLGKAHDAAIERAEEELPGGVAAVCAVTAVQHQAILRATGIALEVDGRAYARALSATEAAAEDRGEAARFLLETSGGEQAVKAIAGEVEEEFGALGEVADDEGTDDELAKDLGGALETLAATAEALGLDLGLGLDEEQDEDDSEDDAPVEE